MSITGGITLVGKHTEVNGLRAKIMACTPTGALEGSRWNVIVPPGNAPGGILKEIPYEEGLNPNQQYVKVKIPKSAQNTVKILSADDLFECITLSLIKDDFDHGPSRFGMYDSLLARVLHYVRTEF